MINSDFPLVGLCPSHNIRPVQCGTFPSRSNRIELPTPTLLVSVSKLKVSLICPYSQYRLSVFLSSIWATMVRTSYCSWPSSLAVPPVSSACVVLPSQAPVPSSDPLGSPVCLQPSDHPPGSSFSIAAPCNWQRLHSST